MPRCSVTGCISRKSNNQIRVSLHRLPRKESTKKKWLEALGPVIKPHIKDVIICSLHFEERNFNRTMGVIRLREDALPQLHPKQNQDNSAILASAKTTSLNNRPESAVPVFEVNVAKLLAANIQDADIAPQSVPRSVPNLAGAPTTMLDEDSQDVDDPLPVPCLSVVPSAPPTTKETMKIAHLKNRCHSLRLKAKALNAKLRRQRIKIENYEKIIKDLQERNLMNNDTVLIVMENKGCIH